MQIPPSSVASSRRTISITTPGIVSNQRSGAVTCPAATISTAIMALPLNMSGTCGKRRNCAIVTQMSVPQRSSRVAPRGTPRAPPRPLAGHSCARKRFTGLEQLNSSASPPPQITCLPRQCPEQLRIRPPVTPSIGIFAARQSPPPAPHLGSRILLLRANIEPTPEACTPRSRPRVSSHGPRQIRVARSAPTTHPIAPQPPLPEPDRGALIALDPVSAAASPIWSPSDGPDAPCPVACDLLTAIPTLAVIDSTTRYIRASRRFDHSRARCSSSDIPRNPGPHLEPIVCPPPRDQPGHTIRRKIVPDTRHHVLLHTRLCRRCTAQLTFR